MADVSLSGPVAPRLSLVDAGEAELVFGAVLESIVELSQPMVLVSGLERSGGAALVTLLDAHAELHVHPHRLAIGSPTVADWPQLDVTEDPDAWLAVLRQKWISERLETGHGAPPHPCLVVPSFLEHLFRVLVARDVVTSPRDILDRYLTAFFNAWLDHRGLRDGSKRWVAAFAPRLAWGTSRTRWRADYPDGRLVVVLREPTEWLAASRAARRRHPELHEELALWRRAAIEAVAAKAEAPEQTLVMTHEALANDADGCTRRLCDWLGIGWSPSLLRPTFNGLALERVPGGFDGPYAALDPTDAAEVERVTGALYAQVRAVADLR